MFLVHFSRLGGWTGGQSPVRVLFMNPIVWSISLFKNLIGLLSHFSMLYIQIQLDACKASGGLVFCMTLCVISYSGVVGPPPTLIEYWTGRLRRQIKCR